MKMGKRKRQTNSEKLQNAPKVNCDQSSPNKKIKTIAASVDKRSDDKLIPVDELCLAKVKNVHVYCENDDIYNAMLNQTNVQYNNNKYYLLQLLEDDCKKEYFVWFRWGRVGKKGQSSLQSFKSNLSAAKDCFTEKFRSKTNNTWDTRKDFIKVPGKYDLLQMDYNDDDNNSPSKLEESKKIKSNNLSKSKLKKKLQDLMKLIFDLEAMEKSVKEMNYDANKTPLGKLTKEQISFGFLALKKIEEYIINNNVKGSDFIEACNEFYTRIPHDFGMKRPPLIKNISQLKEKLNLIETLQGIEVAMNLMNKDLLKNLNPIDYHYQMLECDLEPLKPSSKEYKMIDLYLQNTHGDTHKHYSLTIIDIFKCYKEKENENFIDYGNRMLLWHGSRLSNWPGILKQGLRIAPPEAPVTGYMFGKGVYFADMCSKSANYCYATNEGLLLLCEVSLGNQNKLINANYDANKLPKDKHSVMGLGRTVPNPDEDIILPDGVKVTVGKPTELKTSDNRSLMYNEYIIYNTRQIKMRYLIRVKFNFNN